MLKHDRPHFSNLQQGKGSLRHRAQRRIDACRVKHCPPAVIFALQDRHSQEMLSRPNSEHADLVLEFGDATALNETESQQRVERKGASCTRLVLKSTSSIRSFLDSRQSSIGLSGREPNSASSSGDGERGGRRGLEPRKASGDAEREPAGTCNKKAETGSKRANNRALPCPRSTAWRPSETEKAVTKLSTSSTDVSGPRQPTGPEA